LTEQRHDDGRGARPVVGITTYITQAAWGVWQLETALVPADYVHAVERAGGRPLLVPPSPNGIEETLDSLDGLILSGGSDLGPDLYGQEAHPETTGVVPERDSAEMALLAAALDRDLPVLAICRGSQILNVALGGDLIQHIPDVVGSDRHKQVAGAFADHEISVADGTRLSGLIGDRAAVKSHHHQGFGRIGEGLRVAAQDEDGTVEGLEDPSRRFAVGVLWHPEAGEDARLFEALVQEATAYRSERHGRAQATTGGTSEAQ
jgi:gamma-glutamyl-gamma-aminobutyrate hydrolase PuuD